MPPRTILFVAALVACGSSTPPARAPAPAPPVAEPAPPVPAPAAAPAPAAPAAPADDDAQRVAQGKALFDSKGCSSCHTIDGTPRVGPSLLGYFGAKLYLPDGTEVIGNEQRLVASFDQPEPLGGFAPAMPAYGVNLSADERQALAAFVRSLK